MTSEPYASARRVFWVVDNGASHRRWTAAARLSDAFPSATMIHLPVHASWLNQVEIYFSVVQRKLLTLDDFANVNIANLNNLAGAAHRVRAPLQRRGPTLRLALQPRGPQRAHRPHRRMTPTNQRA